MSKKKKVLILGIESSCDETGAALLRVSPQNRPVLLNNIVFSQVPLHKIHGGIIPEVAARAHIKKIVPVINQALGKTSWSEIDLIAAVNGPGLVTSLLVGLETAKTISYSKQIPLVGVNHLKAHLYAAWLKENPPLPAIGLIASGGHSKLILIKKMGDFQEIGRTRDDAAGECFDKVAQLLELGYPGGPAISQRAAEYEKENSPLKIDLPRPMINSENFDFSFSGLKTAVLYLLKNKGIKNPSQKPKLVSALAAEVEQTIVDILVKKTIRAASQFAVRSVILSGGVAANNKLRNQLKSATEQLGQQTKFFVPAKKFCTDNAAMAALAGYFQYQYLSTARRRKLKDNWRTIKVDPNLGI